MDLSFESVNKSAHFSHGEIKDCCLFQNKKEKKKKTERLLVFHDLKILPTMP